MSATEKLQVYKRSDGKHEWRLIVSSDIVATSGGQGYESATEALQMGTRVVRGVYEEASIEVMGQLPKEEETT